ncbi:uncharacterized protein LOC109862889 isoform X2 [Pseudomyrmex gracilis]|uniref:uncharacterized protein LOC109862889 isoform X2 n=1 Tax=Pseudomyrmex gracilis TaxID=219809 RepID=UPI0009948F27|nr:uncharacterized protein LOC109862889 isoform X2 [Pseudomyrmex gracilis]
MVRICFLCKKKATKNANFTIHEFPKEVSIRAQWLHACKLSDKDNVTHVYICSDHFIQSDYRHSTELLVQKKWLLKPEAVPSIGVLNPPATKLQFQSTFKDVIQEKRHDNEQQKLYATPKKRRFAEPRKQIEHCVNALLL